MDLMKLTEIFINKIKKDYRDDVAIVHIHGSIVYNDTHDLSDLDMYFVPKTPRGYNLACDFIYKGVGTDFWGVSWERLEHIAAHEESTSSIITEGRLLYYGNNDDLNRFEQLKAKALDKSDKRAWYDRARKQLDIAYKNAFLAQNANSLCDARKSAIGLVYDISFALAQLNLSPIKRGRKNLKREIMSMPHVPENFAELYDAIFLSNESEPIKNACAGLLINTAKLVDDITSESPQPFKDVFHLWYEEMIQSYNKIYHACETGEIYSPLFAAVEYSFELSEMLKSAGVDADLPDMVGAYDSGDLTKIAQAAKEHQRMFERILREHDMEPVRFESIEEVENFLSSK